MMRISKSGERTTQKHKHRGDQSDKVKKARKNGGRASECGVVQTRVGSGRKKGGLDEAAGMFEAGVLTSTLTREIAGIDAASLREAHSIVASGGSIGKVVLTR